MQKAVSARVSNFIFIVSCLLLIYMPLHVFIVQSASLLTGGIEVWKAAKDVFVFMLFPVLIFLSYRSGLQRDKTFRWLVYLGAGYGLLHGLFLLFDSNDHAMSTITASIYNTRLLIFLLLGYVVGSHKQAEKYTKLLLTIVVIVASLVALLGVLQYFLPHDLLTHIGYGPNRGVKPLFFIDDKPDLPRIMSTLKDPNSLGAYLILPILLTAFAKVKQSANKQLFARPFRQGTLAIMLVLQLAALLLTFSRGSALGLFAGIVTILCVVTGRRVFPFIRRHVAFLLIFGFVISFLALYARNTYVVQNVIFHADESTVLADPNELRVVFVKNALDDIIDQPFGHGPGTAGIVSIRNPNGGLLTENYYLQIAYEVGWLGLLLFVAIISIISFQLSIIARKQPLGAVLFSAFVAYIFYSLLIHLWSNEAVALQWWLLTGVVLGSSFRARPEKRTKLS